MERYLQTQTRLHRHWHDLIALPSVDLVMMVMILISHNIPNVDSSLDTFYVRVTPKNYKKLIGYLNRNVKTKCTRCHFLYLVLESLYRNGSIWNKELRRKVLIQKTVLKEGTCT